MLDGPVSNLMKIWISRRMIVIAAVALTGIALHLILRYGMHREAQSYPIPLWIVLVFGGIPLFYELLKKVAKFEFGSELLAGILPLTPLMLPSLVKRADETKHLAQLGSWPTKRCTTASS